MTKSGAATAATGLQQKAVLRDLWSGFAADRRKSQRMQALQGERCDGIRQESMFEVRLFGATPWAAALEIKKNGEPGSSPFFLVPYAAATCRRHLRRRAPQKRCVNGCQNSRPGGVILSPFRALATTIRFYSRATPDASEIFIIRTAAPTYFCLGSLCDPPPWPPPDRSPPPPEACCVACDCGA
jgi:hypothetical protein